MSGPQSVEELFAAAVRLHQAGDLPAAERAYNDLVRVVPNYAPALSNLGVIRAKLGDEAEAVRLYQLALASQPEYPDALFNLGNVHRRAGRIAEAGDLFYACTQADPGHLNAHFNLGVMFATVGRFADAEAAFRRAVDLEQGTIARSHLRLGEVLHRLGRAAEAVPFLQAYLSACPDDLVGTFQLALALAGSGKAADAIELLRRLLKRTPDNPEAHNALGLAHASLGRQDDAAYHFEKAVALRPELAEAWSNLAVCQAEQGRADDAIGSFRHALATRPAAPLIHSNLLLNLNFSSRVSPEEVRDEHFAWGDRFAPPVPPPAVHPPTDPARRLRIGYLSGDFRTHSQAGLLHTLLAGHDRDQFEVFAYATVHRPDAVTDALRPLADHWRSVVGLSPATAADAIRDDRIDVLVEVGGHSCVANLLIVADRPAAVQVSLGGIPGTTGCSAVGYRVTDPVSDPVGETEQLYREQLVRLPEVSWVYRPPAEAGEVSPLPGLSRRQFTFGCLNNSSKISEATLDAWVKLVLATPGSRLVLLSGQSAAGQRRLTDKFVRAGIPRDRVQLVTRQPRDRYLAQYAEFDLALDPFPYGGGVTTADSLWMGVPVLTIPGRTAVGRQGLMQLLAVGLGEFVVPTADDLPAVAKSWMNRRQELAAIRGGLRDRMAASPLCDGPRYVRSLEDAILGTWRTAVAAGSLRASQPM